MFNQLFNSFLSLPRECVVILLGMSPISEVRGAIPIALSLELSPLRAFILSTISNLIPIIPLLLFLETASGWLSRRWDPMNNFFIWLFTRTRKKSHLVERYGPIGLALFVAIPFPLTGAWSGCVVAYLFGMRLWSAFLAISIGVVIAALIVTLTCLGVITLWPWGKEVISLLK